MSRIFISYKRADREKVLAVKKNIERATGEKCWIDLDGIESDAQFKNVIIRAINKSEIVIFMYSRHHLSIDNFEKDWTVRELNFAASKNKRIIFYNLDGSSLTDEFAFDFGSKQQIDGRSQEANERLMADLCKWLNATQPKISNGNPPKVTHDKSPKVPSSYSPKATRGIPPTVPPGTPPSVNYSNTRQIPTVKTRSKNKNLYIILGIIGGIIIIPIIIAFICGVYEAISEELKKEEDVSEDSIVVVEEIEEESEVQQSLLSSGINEFQGVFENDGTNYYFILKLTLDGDKLQTIEWGTKESDLSYVEAEYYLSPDGNQIYFKGKDEDGAYIMMEVHRDSDKTIYNGEITLGKYSGPCTLMLLSR